LPVLTSADCIAITDLHFKSLIEAALMFALCFRRRSVNNKRFHNFLGRGSTLNTSIMGYRPPSHLTPP
jgi:hypothetical protein